MPRPTPADRVMPIDWSTRPSSSIAMHRLVNAPPSVASSDPPNSSGTTRPNRPRSPIVGTRSAGKWCSRSHWATCGSTASVGELADHLAEVLVVLAQLVHRRSFAQVVPTPGRGAWHGVVLDVDVNVKQYSPVCQPPPRMPWAPPPRRRRRTRPHLVDRRGRRRVRGHPPHGAALRGARADLAGAPRHGPGLPPSRPHPARPDPAGQAARVPARGDPHDHRPLRRPAGAAQPARVRARARSTSAVPTSSSAAATSTRRCPSSPSSSAAAAPTSAGWPEQEVRQGLVPPGLDLRRATSRARAPRRRSSRARRPSRRWREPARRRHRCATTMPASRS